MPETLRVGILAGELSGDILGAGLMAELRKQHASVEFIGIGGPEMLAQGLKSQVAMDRLSVMGFVDPLKRLPELLRIRRDLYDSLISNPPDVFVGIDSPGFCIDLELKLKLKGIPTVHYVSPSVWAWREKRIVKIAKAVDLMLTLFPFEVSIYEKYNVPVKFVGHPLADIIDEQHDSSHAKNALGLKVHDKVLALLPGSRKGEVERLSRPFLETAQLRQNREPALQVVIPAANDARRLQLQVILGEFPQLKVRLISGQARTVLAAADQVLIASGTATLEALLFKKPMVVCYQKDWLSYAIISRLLKVDSFSLPNLLTGKKLVPELLQEDVNAQKLDTILDSFTDKEVVTLKDEFSTIHKKLRCQASEQAAGAVLELVWQRRQA